VNVAQFLVLERSLEFPTYDVFKTVVGDDMMMCTLVLDRYGLLHQTSLFELIAIDE
jgi:hypothetical protein